MTLLVAFSFLVSLTVVSASPTTPAPACLKLNAYVAYESGGLIISENGGQTWARRDPFGSATPIHSIWAADANVFLGTDAGLSVSKNGGHTWTAQSFRKDTYIPITSVFGIGNRIVLAGYANLITSEDLGKTWTVQTIPSVSGYLQGVYATEKRIFVGLGTSGVGVSEDGGVTWRILNANTPFASVGVLAIAGSGEDIYVQLTGRDIASIAISNDGGESWGMQEVTTVTSAGLPNNIVVDGTTVLVGTTVGLALSDHVWDDWDLKTTVDGLASNTTCVAGLGDTILAGTDKGLSISRDRGHTWTTPVTPLGNQKITAVFLNCLK